MKSRYLEFRQWMLPLLIVSLALLAVVFSFVSAIEAESEVFGGELHIKVPGQSGVGENQ